MFIFAKNFVLLVVLVSLIQLIRRLTVKPSDVVSDWDLGGWVQVANFLEVYELGHMGLGCRSSGSFWVWVAHLLEVFGGLVRWLWLPVVWCGGYGCRLSRAMVVQWWCRDGCRLCVVCVVCLCHNSDNSSWLWLVGNGVVNYRGLILILKVQVVWLMKCLWDDFGFVERSSHEVLTKIIKINKIK
jgi:hypothetical protein